VTSASRLLESLEVFRGDFRVQVVFAVDGGSAFVDGVHAVLLTRGAKIVPWAQVSALRPALVITATENADLDAVSGPIVVLPHGVGFHKYVPDALSDGERISGVVPRQRVAGLTMVVSHPDQRDQLRRMVPGVATEVVGDPVLERMVTSDRMAGDYRQALGVEPGQRLVLLSSTWGPGSLWGAGRHLPRQVTGALPYDEYRVALVLHPNVWFGHSPWQVRAWLAEALDAGLALIPPTEGWQAAVTAADTVIGDHGSVTLYAAALGKPVLLAAFGDEVVAGTTMAELGAAAVRLDPDRDLLGQITQARPVQEVALRAFAATDGSTRRLQELLYGLLDLPVPQRPAGVRVWPCPPPEHRAATSFAVYTDVSVPGVVTVRRYAPDHRDEETSTRLRHRASFTDELDEDAVASASIVVARHGGQAEMLLRRHPGALCVVADGDVSFRDGTSVHVGSSGDADPMCAAAVVYALWRTSQPLTGEVILQVGADRVTLTLAAA
jgi:hypothetical protein